MCFQMCFLAVWLVMHRNIHEPNAPGGFDIIRNGFPGSFNQCLDRTGLGFMVFFVFHKTAPSTSTRRKVGWGHGHAEIQSDVEKSLLARDVAINIDKNCKDPALTIPAASICRRHL